MDLRSVTFGYQPDRPVLHNINLALAPGTMTALVGPSGSGKSTLAALVARFHDVDDGAVLVHGTDVRRLPPDDLYRQVGFVFQDVQLVQGTVRDNIALARPDATDDEVRAAARAAHIDNRVQQLPRGYTSVVGTDARFSTGEAQRLTVARALLSDPDILILDEATAFADPEAEHEVQQAVSRLLAGRTVLVIAHRLRTVVDVDEIVVLDQGRVVEQGCHDHLLDLGGLYRSLWESSTTGPSDPVPATTDWSDPATGATREDVTT